MSLERLGLGLGLGIKVGDGLSLGLPHFRPLLQNFFFFKQKVFDDFS